MIDNHYDVVNAMQNRLNHKHEEISRLLLKIEEKNPRQMLAFIAWSSIWFMVYICHVFLLKGVCIIVFCVSNSCKTSVNIYNYNDTCIDIHLRCYVVLQQTISQRTSGCWNEQLLGAGLSQFFIADETKKILFCFCFFLSFFFFVCWLFFSDKLWFTTSYFRTWLNTNWSVMCKNPLANLSSIIRYTNRKKLPASINVSFML